VKLTPDQFAEWIALEVEGRRKGGPNLQDKYLKLVDQLPEEIRQEYRARTIELWSKVENDLAKPRPTTVWINGRRYSADDVDRWQREQAASFFGPKSRPMADPEPEDAPKEETKPEEPKQEEQEADQEAAYVEDDTNATPDAARRMWRLHSKRSPSANERANARDERNSSRNRKKLLGRYDRCTSSWRCNAHHRQRRK